jgi:hypothetical protein
VSVAATVVRRTVAHVAFGFLALTGCSTQSWYEGLKLSAQNECRRQPSGDVESCLARVNKMSYEDYERQRTGPRP